MQSDGDGSWFRKSEDVNTLIAAAGDQPSNIRDAVAPAFESRPYPIVAVKCAEVPGNDSLFVLPGHIGLAEYEVTLGIAQELSGSVVTLRNLPGALRYAIDETAKALEIDLVVVDMSPSLGPLNQNLLMTSDYFIVPMQPDYFSTMAIESLSSVIPKWKGWADAARSLPALKDAAYPFPQTSPKFIGYVIQNYRPRGGNVPSLAFRKWIDEIESGVEKTLLPTFQRNDMLAAEGVYAAAGYDPRKPILQMPDFNSLIARSQQHQVPIYELSDAQLEQSGVVLDRTKESMGEFDKLFERAASRVINVVEADAAKDLI